MAHWIAGLLVGCLGLMGCASMQSVSPSLLAAENGELKPGISTTTDVQKSFGTPGKILSPASNVEAWLYFQGGDAVSPVYSCIFSADTKKLEKLVWFVRDTDQESNLELLQKKFARANFKSYHPPWTNPHSAPTELIYEDRAIGVRIVYETMKSKVKSVSWSVPGRDGERNLSTAKAGAPYQIGGS